MAGIRKNQKLLTTKRHEKYEKKPFQRGCPPKAGGGLLKKIYRKERKEEFSREAA